MIFEKIIYVILVLFFIYFWITSLIYSSECPYLTRTEIGLDMFKYLQLDFTCRR